jgi:hypothetical protein
MSAMEQAESCLTEEAPAAAQAAAALPCLNRSNCTRLPPSAAKTAWLLTESVKRFIEKFGLEKAGFLTLTFADHVIDPKEAQKRFHSLASHVFNKRYHRRWIRVFERQKSGRIHYHVLIAVDEDIRSGVDFEAFAKRDYRSAGPALRGEWAFWRITAPRYRFGRTEMMPLYKNEQAVAIYIGKYIAKHLENRLAIDKRVRLVEYGRGCRIGTTKFQFNSPGAWLWRQKLRRFAHQVSPDREINMDGLSRRLGRGNWIFKHLGRIRSIDLEGVAYPTQYLWILHDTMRGRRTLEDSHLALLCRIDAESESGYQWPGSKISIEKAIELFWSKVQQMRNPNPRPLSQDTTWNWCAAPSDRIAGPNDPY